MNKERMVVGICLFLAWLRTSEAMVPYSPQTILGVKADWIIFLWAYVAAAAVEGVLWMAYTKLRQSVKDHNTKWAAAVVAGLSIIFSAVMNVIDVRTQNGTLTLAAGSWQVDFLVNTIVLIPLIVAVLFGLVEIIDANTPDTRKPSQQFRPPRPMLAEPGDEMAQWQREKASHSNGHSNAVRTFTNDREGPNPILPRSASQ